MSFYQISLSLFIVYNKIKNDHCLRENTEVIGIKNNKMFECDICPKQYRCKRELREHILLHYRMQNTQKCNKCTVCDRKYTYRRGLREHIKNQHPELVPIKIRNFECHICHRKYSYRRGLYEHTRHQHPNEISKEKQTKQEICNICKKKNYNIHALHKHLKTNHQMEIGFSETNIFICRICNRKYQYKSNLTQHMRLKHAEELFKCADCGKILLRRSKLIRHIQKKHCTLEKSRTKINKVKQGIRVCPLCMSMYTKKSNILYHMKEVHKIQIHEELHEYSSEESFNKWKNNIETTTHSRYILYNKYKSDSEIVVNFVCHRSGWYQSRGQGIRNIRRVGTKKINSYCPSEIFLRIRKKKKMYLVNFIGTHVGHNTNELRELRYLKLPEKEQEPIITIFSTDDCIHELISDQSQNSISNITTLYDSSDCFTWTIDQVCLTEEVQYFTISSECLSIMMVESWIKNNNDYVLYYKRKNEKDFVFSNLQENDFVLIIADEYQIQMLRNFGANILAIDATHEPKRCDFELSIVTVLDEFHQKYPCIFTFSNRKDEYVYRIIFSKIKEKIGEIKPKIFISDLNENYIKPWENVMSIPKKRLFCSWHVSQNWKKNLNKIQVAQKRYVTKTILENLRTELNVSCFHELLQQFINNSDPDMRNFLTYFNRCFLKNVSTWADCHRKYAGVNTTTEVEKFLTFVQRNKNDNKKTNVSLEKALNLLGNMLQNFHMEKMQVEANAKLVPKIKNLRRKHVEAVKNIDKVGSVNQLTKFKWYVPSFNDEEIIHCVEQILDLCECELRCEACSSCLHRFICSCSENCIQFNMCEHIHLVCLIKNEKQLKNKTEKFTMIEEYEKFIEIVEES